MAIGVATTLLPILSRRSVYHFVLDLPFAMGLKWGAKINIYTHEK